MARVAGDETAFSWRDQPVLLWLITLYQEIDRAAAIEAWTAAFRSDLSAAGAPTYVNFMGAEDTDAVRGAYPASSY